MSDEKVIKFDELPESKQIRSITEAGIHRGFLWVGAEYQPRQAKKEKVKQADGSTKEVETDKFTGPMAKFTFKSLTGETSMIYNMFPPPTNESEIKFYGDKYEGGVPIRKNTADEQIRAEFNKKFYFFEQLAKAINIAPDRILAFKKGVTGPTDKLFKIMFDAFVKSFTVANAKDKPVDIKMLWNNNDTKKTSFLGLADASANNIVIAQHIPDKPTLLSIQQFEQKKLRRAYANNDRAPQGDATELSQSGNTWKPIEENSGPSDAGSSTVDEGPLF